LREKPRTLGGGGGPVGRAKGYLQRVQSREIHQGPGQKKGGFFATGTREVAFFTRRSVRKQPGGGKKGRRYRRGWGFTAILEGWGDLSSRGQEKGGSLEQKKSKGTQKESTRKLKGGLATPHLVEREKLTKWNSEMGEKKKT